MLTFLSMLKKKDFIWKASRSNKARPPFPYSITWLGRALAVLWRHRSPTESPGISDPCLTGSVSLQPLAEVLNGCSHKWAQWNHESCYPICLRSIPNSRDRVAAGWQPLWTLCSLPYFPTPLYLPRYEGFCPLQQALSVTRKSPERMETMWLDYSSLHWLTVVCLLLMEARRGTGQFAWKGGTGFLFVEFFSCEPKNTSNHDHLREEWPRTTFHTYCSHSCTPLQFNVLISVFMGSDSLP